MSANTQTQLISVTVNLDALKTAISDQSIPIMIGIVGAFVLMVMCIALAFVFKKYLSTFLLSGFGFTILFISFVLYYVDAGRRKSAIDDKIVTAQTNLYAGAAQLDCPLFFKHTVDANGTGYVCDNVNGIKEIGFSGTTDTLEPDVTVLGAYAAAVQTNDVAHLYPYEDAFAGIATANVSVMTATF